MLLSPHPTHFTHICAHSMFPTCPLQQELLKKNEGEPEYIYLCEERGCGTEVLLGSLCHTRLSRNVQVHPGCLAAYSDSSKTPNSL